MLRTIAIALTIFVFTTTASAQNASRPLQSDGLTTSFGVPDCGEWVSKSRPGSEIWLSGYLSGLNTMFNRRAVKGAPAYDPLEELQTMNQAYIWMDNWCKEHPLNRVDEGASYLLLELMSMKVKTYKAKQQHN